MSIDIKRAICKNCGLEKMKLGIGTYSKKSHRKFVDENGFQWNGRLCADCQRVRVKLHKRKVRSKPKEKLPDV